MVVAWVVTTPGIGYDVVAGQAAVRSSRVAP